MITIQDIDARMRYKVEYAQVVLAHKAYVTEAGLRLGLPLDELERHDDSKLSAEEFVPYMNKYTVPRITRKPVEPAHEKEYTAAWLHHIHHNPHHWQHWIFPDGYSPENSNVVDGCVPMPERYILEMVADWQGASLAYTGLWDMTEWLVQNLCKLKLHPVSVGILKNILVDQGYKMNEVLAL